MSVYIHNNALITLYSKDQAFVKKLENILDSEIDFAQCTNFVVFDLDFYGDKRLEEFTACMQKHSGAKVFVVTNHVSLEECQFVMSSGANGYSSTDITEEHLAHIIEVVACAGIWLSNDHMIQMLCNDALENDAYHNLDVLSRREKMISMLIVRGFDNKEIAKELRLSEKTIKNHITQIFAKLGVGNRVALLNILEKHFLSSI